MHFAAVDIGSPGKGNLGWAVIGSDADVGGTDPDELVRTLATISRSGPMVLGFEAPMYVPAGRQVHALLKARPGEGSRAWSVAAGATTTAIALAVVPWILDGVRAAVPHAVAWQDWTRLPRSSGEILVYEAFVSGGPSDGHIADARAAAVATRDVMAAPLPESMLQTEECMSLLGAALLHSGLSNDLTELRRQCLVVRAAKTLSVSPPADLHRI